VKQKLPKLTYQPYLDWINGQHEEMISFVQEWAHINSFSENLDGLNTMSQHLKRAFSALESPIQEMSLNPHQSIDAQGELISKPLGKALSIRKRPDAPIQIFLGGHMDTVYPLQSPFKACTRIDTNTLRGPGVADMKGGLVIMLTALKALERSPFAKEIGWEVLLNPDEEIGSPGSAPLLEKCATRAQVGLIFEPSLPDGSFVSARKGSANFTLVVRGQPAHVGRDFAKGRSAVVSLAHFIGEVESLNRPDKGIIVNVGRIHGGEAHNVVPALAIAHFNCRTQTIEQMKQIQIEINSFVNDIQQRDGIKCTLHTSITRPPKEFDLETQKLFESIKECSDDLGLSCQWRETGGVCDGNILAAGGVPTIDTLGVIGGNIHTPNEFVLLDSLVTRARLTALFLMKIASREIPIMEKFHGKK
jgi:glutamate carboxypeptidase